MAQPPPGINPTEAWFGPYRMADGSEISVRTVSSSDELVNMKLNLQYTWGGAISRRNPFMWTQFDFTVRRSAYRTLLLIL
jgi:hypothetical protein